MIVRLGWRLDIIGAEEGHPDITTVDTVCIIRVMIDEEDATELNFGKEFHFKDDMPDDPDLLALTNDEVIFLLRGKKMESQADGSSVTE